MYSKNTYKFITNIKVLFSVEICKVRYSLINGGKYGNVRMGKMEQFTHKLTNLD